MSKADEYDLDQHGLALFEATGFVVRVNEVDGEVDFDAEPGNFHGFIKGFTPEEARLLADAFNEAANKAEDPRYERLREIVKRNPLEAIVNYVKAQENDHEK